LARLHTDRPTRFAPRCMVLSATPSRTQCVLARIRQDSEPAAPNFPDLSRAKDGKNWRSIRHFSPRRRAGSTCDNETMEHEERRKTCDDDSQCREAGFLVAIERGQGEHLRRERVEVERPE